MNYFPVYCTSVFCYTLYWKSRIEKRMNTGAVYEFRFFHALFLFSSHGLGENMEVITTWDEVTKTLVADRKGERFMPTSTSTK